MYLDDVSLGGSPEAILHDLEVVESFKEIGLVLNNQKSEIICTEPVTSGTILGGPGRHLPPGVSHWSVSAALQDNLV